MGLNTNETSFKERLLEELDKNDVTIDSEEISFLISELIKKLDVKPN